MCRFGGTRFIAAACPRVLDSPPPLAVYLLVLENPRRSPVALKSNHAKHANSYNPRKRAVQSLVLICSPVHNPLPFS